MEKELKCPVCGDPGCRNLEHLLAVAIAVDIMEAILLFESLGE